MTEMKFTDADLERVELAFLDRVADAMAEAPKGALVREVVAETDLQAMLLEAAEDYVYTLMTDAEQARRLAAIVLDGLFLGRLSWGRPPKPELEAMVRRAAEEYGDTLQKRVEALDLKLARHGLGEESDE